MIITVGRLSEVERLHFYFARPSLLGCLYSDGPAVDIFGEDKWRRNLSLTDIHTQQLVLARRKEVGSVSSHGSRANN